MSLNQNGLYSASWTVTDNYGKVSEGAVVGIAFGWIIGAIGLYILGILIICKCIPKRKEPDSESEDDRKSSEEKRVGKSSSSSRKRKSSDQSEEGQVKEIRRKRLPQQNPTSLELTEMDKPTQYQTVTLKFKDGRQV